MKRLCWLILGLLIVLVWSDKAPCQTGPAHRQYQNKAAKLRESEVKKLVSLANWCVQNDLEKQAREVLERLLRVDPANATARKLLQKAVPSQLRDYSTDAEVILTDGGTLRAKLQLRHLKLETPYGTLTFPPTTVSVLEFNVDENVDVVMADNLTICGKAKLGNAHAQTKAGRIELSRKAVKTIRLLRPCLSCKRSGKIKCDRCKGQGRISQHSPCPICNGVDSKRPCENCNGTGRIVCMHCGGQGTWWVNTGGFLMRHRCGHCKGRGWMRCKPCNGKGSIYCPGCNGSGTITQRIECPKCHEAKKVTCPDCQGKGHLPVPELVWPIPCEPVTQETPNETVETPLRRIAHCAWLLLLLTGLAWADSVTLKTGQTFNGEILSENRAQVVIKTAGGIMTFQRTRIAAVKSDRKARMEFERRHTTLVRETVKGHLEVAKWCLEHDLSDVASRHYLHVLELDPENIEAAVGLKRVVKLGPTQPQVDVELKLVDQSVVKGSTAGTPLTISTTYGELRIPLVAIVSVSLSPKRGEDRIITHNFPVTGDILDATIVLTTRMGELSVKIENIAELKTRHKLSPVFIADDFDTELTNLRRIGLDVMLVYDATDSMEAALVAIKRNFRKTAHCLKDHVPSVRIGLVAYRDSREHDPDEFTYQVKLVSPLSTELHNIYDLFLNQAVGGGGDIPEAVHEGLQTAMEQAGWDPNARKVIILLGDAPPHKENDGLNTLYKMVDTWTASAKGFVYTIDTTGFGKLLPEFKEIARHGGGESFTLPNDELLAECITLCILGPRWAEQVRPAYKAAPNEALNPLDEE